MGGKIVRTINPGLSDIYGLAWDGARLWVVDDNTDQIYQVNPNTGTVIQWQDTPGSDPRGATFDGRTLWMADAVTGSISQMTGGLLPNPPANGGMPSLNDAICFWNLDEAAGVRADAVGTGCGGAGCNLTDNNTVTQAAGVSAQTVNAAQFTAANSEYLSHLDAASLSVGDIYFTLTAWVYLDDKTVDRGFVSKFDGTIAGSEYVLGYEDSVDRFEFVVYSAGATFGTAVANTLGSPSTATWYFVVGWHDPVANTVNIQVDNGAVDSVAYADGTADTGSLFSIGSLNGALWFMDGRIDAAGLWKRLLTAAERTWLYNAGLGRQYPF